MANNEIQKSPETSKDLDARLVEAYHKEDDMIKSLPKTGFLSSVANSREDMKFAMLVNAELRFNPKERDLMRSKINMAHDEAMDINFRKYLELMPDPLRQALNWVQRVGDDFQTEAIIDDETLRYNDFTYFFKAQIEINKAKIAILEFDIKNSKTPVPPEQIGLFKEEIAKLKEENALYTEMATKASIEQLTRKEMEAAKILVNEARSPLPKKNKG